MKSKHSTPWQSVDVTSADSGAGCRTYRLSALCAAIHLVMSLWPFRHGEAAKCKYRW